PQIAAAVREHGAEVDRMGSDASDDPTGSGIDLDQRPVELRDPDEAAADGDAPRLGRDRNRPTDDVIGTRVDPDHRAGQRVRAAMRTEGSADDPEQPAPGGSAERTSRHVDPGGNLRVGTSLLLTRAARQEEDEDRRGEQCRETAHRAPSYTSRSRRVPGADPRAIRVSKRRVSSTDCTTGGLGRECRWSRGAAVEGKASLVRPTTGRTARDTSGTAEVRRRRGRREIRIRGEEITGPDRRLGTRRLLGRSAGDGETNRRQIAIRGRNERGAADSTC